MKKDDIFKPLKEEMEQILSLYQELRQFKLSKATQEELEEQLEFSLNLLYRISKLRYQLVYLEEYASNSGQPSIMAMVKSKSSMIANPLTNLLFSISEIVKSIRYYLQRQDDKTKSHSVKV